MDGGWNGPKPQPKAASRVGARGAGVRPSAPLGHVAGQVDRPLPVYGTLPRLASPWCHDRPGQPVIRPPGPALYPRQLGQPERQRA